MLKGVTEPVCVLNCSLVCLQKQAKARIASGVNNGQFDSPKQLELFRNEQKEALLETMRIFSSPIEMDALNRLDRYNGKVPRSVQAQRKLTQHQKLASDASDSPEAVQPAA